LIVNVFCVCYLPVSIQSQMSSMGIPLSLVLVSSTCYVFA